MTDHTGIKILGLDIETAPTIAYVWGLFKENIPIDRLIHPGYTLCFAASWEHDKSNVIFRSLLENEMDAMLEVMWELLDEADVVIHYNGKKFDIPTLNREFVKHGFVPPSPYRQIDLYQVVRSNFRFQSNKLDFVARELGIKSKVQHKGMDLWKDCIAALDYEAGEYIPNELLESWAVMKEYNEWDVGMLWELYNRVQPWIRAHPNRALWLEDNGKPKCPSCGSENVRKRGIERPANVNAYQRYKCNDCGANSRGRLALKHTTKPELR